METKPGLKTTEFWITIVAKLAGLLAAFGFFTPEQVDAITQASVQLGGVIVMMLAAFGYSVSRGQAKKGMKPDDPQVPVPGLTSGVNGSAGFITMRLLVLVLAMFMVVALAFGCAGDRPTVCNDPGADKSFICSTMGEAGIIPEDVDPVIVAVNIRLIQDGVYKKADVYAVLDAAEMYLSDSMATYRALANLVLKEAQGVPELLILSPFLTYLDSTRWISAFDRDLLLTHIQHHRDWLKGVQLE